jgi:hypothetical protein
VQQHGIGVKRLPMSAYQSIYGIDHGPPDQTLWPIESARERLEIAKVYKALRYEKYYLVYHFWRYRQGCKAFNQ